MGLIEINNETFENEVLKSDIPVIVDLWAPWCGPCKAITPTLEEIAAEYDSKVKIVKVNIYESPSVASNYKVMSIPTLLIFASLRSPYFAIACSAMKTSPLEG